jgi:hypothetical protein
VEREEYWIVKERIDSYQLSAFSFQSAGKKRFRNGSFFRVPCYQDLGVGVVLVRAVDSLFSISVAALSGTWQIFFWCNSGAEIVQFF